MLVFPSELGGLLQQQRRLSNFWLVELEVGVSEYFLEGWELLAGARSRSLLDHLDGLRLFLPAGSDFPFGGSLRPAVLLLVLPLVELLVGPLVGDEGMGDPIVFWWFGDLLLAVILLQELLELGGVGDGNHVDGVAALELVLLELDLQDLGVEVAGHLDLQGAQLLGLREHGEMAPEVVERRLRAVVRAEWRQPYFGVSRDLKSMGTVPSTVGGEPYSTTSTFRLFFMSSRYFWKFRIGQRISYSCSFGSVGTAVFSGCRAIGSCSPQN